MSISITATVMPSGYTFQQEMLLLALEQQALTGMLMTNPRVTGFTSFAKAVLNFLQDKVPTLRDRHKNHQDFLIDDISSYDSL